MKTPFLGPHQEKVTINEIVDDYVEQYKQGGPSGIARVVSPQMQSHLKCLKAFFGSLLAMQVGTRDIKAFRAKLKAEKKANATVNRPLQLLLTAYRYAVSTDPPKLARAPGIELLEEKNVRKGKFSPLEAELVANSFPPYMADLARFAYQTRARAGEIRKLRWCHRRPDAIAVPGEIAKNREDRQWQSLTDDPLMRLSAVAEALDLSRDTLKRWIRAGRLPAVKLGGVYRVRRSRVLALLGNESEVMNATNLHGV